MNYKTYPVFYTNIAKIDINSSFDFSVFHWLNLVIIWKPRFLSKVLLFFANFLSGDSHWSWNECAPTAI